MASIYEASNTDGHWTAQVNTGGRRRSKTFPTKRDAERWARAEEATSDRRGAATRDITINDAIAAYIEAVEEQKPTAKGRVSALRHIGELIGRRKLSAVDVPAIRAFVQERLAEGVQPQTVGIDLVLLGTVLRNGSPLIAGADPSGALAALASARRILMTTGQIATGVERDRRPTDSELVLLQAHWAKRRRRKMPMWDLVQFAVATAMRQSEICRIEWRDLDVEGRMIVVRDRKDPRRKTGNHGRVPLVVGPVVIGGVVVDPLAIILAQRKQGAVIFPYVAASVSSYFSRATEACGIDDLRFHDLRHDGVSRLFEAGLDISTVALVSGHKSWSQLKRYANLKPEMVHERLAQLGRVASG